MADLQAEVDRVKTATPAGQVATLTLEDITFTDFIDVRALLDPSNAKANEVIPCPFAWIVRRCTFLQGFSANQIHFEQDADFEKFSCLNTNFSGATFSGANTNFNGAKFSGPNTNFSGTKFSGQKTDFCDAQFPGAYTSFIKAQFSASEITDFRGVQFSGKRTDFRGVQFSGKRTYLIRVQFSASEITDFRGAQFFSDEMINFSQARFSSESLRFENCQCFKGSQLIFEKVQFSDKTRLILENWTFHDSSTLIFRNLSPQDKTERLTIRDDQLEIVNPNDPKRYVFENCSLRPGAVTVSHLDLHQLCIKGGNGLSGFSFEQCHWPTRSVHGALGWGLQVRCSPTDVEEKAEATQTDSATTSTDEEAEDKNSSLQQQILDYARLKENAKGQGDAQLACHFHFWQMWYRYHSLSWWKVADWWEKPVLFYYLVTSAFGLSIARPLIWLVVNYVFWGSAYGLLISWMKGEYHPFSMWFASFDYNNWIEGVQLALSHSSPLENMKLEETLGPLINLPAGAPLDPHWHLLFWPCFVVQNAVGLYLLFQLGAAIRNKVRQ